MKIKKFKRRKKVYETLKGLWVVLGAVGIIVIIAGCEGITENIIQLIEGIKQIITGYLIVFGAYIAYCLTEWIENRTKK